MKFEIISLVKNEEDIIENFIKHHSGIADQITLIDNGSTDGTVDIIKKYNNVNLQVRNVPFKFKADLINHYIQKSTCDVVVPLDADELMVLDFSNGFNQKEASKITKDHNKIRQNLETLPHRPVYKIKNIYNIIPNHENVFQLETDFYRSKKIFVSKKHAFKVDAGFHGVSIGQNAQFATNISYLHLHYRNFDAWYRSSVQKMKSRIGDQWNNLNVLKDYKGLSNHVASELYRYLTTGEWCSLKSGVKLSLE